MRISDWSSDVCSSDLRLEQRPLSAIDLVVIHCTELPDLASAREYGERVLYDSGTGNSGHYYIDRDGRVLQFIAPERSTHHTRGYNQRSIGIELINAGRYPNWLDSRQQDRKSTRLNSSPYVAARKPSTPCNKNNSITLT